MNFARPIGGRTGRKARNGVLLQALAKEAHERYMNTPSAAVTVEAGVARLEISYKILDPAYSDSNVFTAVIGGKNDITEAQARSEVTRAAHAWADNERAEGRDIGAWDASGRTY